MIEMAMFVAAGLIVMFARLSWKWKLRVVSNAGLADVFIFILVSFLHWGTFTGMMVAAISALLCSLFLSAMRWAFGHIAHGRYVPGQFNIGAKL